MVLQEAQQPLLDLLLAAATAVDVVFNIAAVAAVQVVEHQVAQLLLVMVAMAATALTQVELQLELLQQRQCILL
jgi:hypothetical protein